MERGVKTLKISDAVCFWENHSLVNATVVLIGENNQVLLENEKGVWILQQIGDVMIEEKITKIVMSFEIN